MRTMTTAAANVLAGTVVPMVVLVEMQLSEPLYLCLADVNIVHAGQTWQGIGAVGSIDQITDASGQAKGVKMTLASVPLDALPLALEENMVHRTVKIHMAVLDPSTYAVVLFDNMFSGVLGQPKISEEGGTGVIEVTAESRALLFRRTKALRYTDADQRQLYPDDTSFRFITAQANHHDIWPSASWYQR